MANETGPINGEQSGKVPYSADKQLSDFTARLDRDSARNILMQKALPGYLFRDGVERRKEFTQGSLFAEMDSYHKSGWTNLDEGLLREHAITYEKGVEARRQLIDRIDPTKILEIVRDIWGRGDIKKTESGAAISYAYLQAGEEIGSESVRIEGSRTYGERNSPIFVPIGYKTGRWNVWNLEVEEEVAIVFGNSKFPNPGNLPGNKDNPYSSLDLSTGAELREFFADYHWQNGHVVSHVEFPYAPLPSAIWSRPDNLGISVTVPYILEEVPSKRYPQGYIQRRPESNQWFDQTATQQEIIDYLAQKMEGQKRMGQLPSQIEQVEMAKIEELRRRGLLIEGAKNPYYHEKVNPAYRNR